MATRKGEKIFIINVQPRKSREEKENCNLWLFDALAEVSGKTLWAQVNAFRTEGVLQAN